MEGIEMIKAMYLRTDIVNKVIKVCKIKDRSKKLDCTPEKIVIMCQGCEKVDCTKRKLCE